MAAFKVGDRVRIIANESGDHRGDMVIGCEGVITRPAAWVKWSLVWLVRVPGVCVGEHDPECDRDEWGCFESELAPLTDPRAQEFIEDMERFAIVTEGVPLEAIP
jgi:hypothetical protein